MTIFDYFLAILQFLKYFTTKECYILVPQVETKILMHDKGGFNQFFPPSSLLDFNSKKWWPWEDIEAGDLKFCMGPSFTNTHAVQKVEHDPRQKMQFKTLYFSVFKMVIESNLIMLYRLGANIQIVQSE